MENEEVYTEVFDINDNNKNKEIFKPQFKGQNINK